MPSVNMLATITYATHVTILKLYKNVWHVFLKAQVCLRTSAHRFLNHSSTTKEVFKIYDNTELLYPLLHSAKSACNELIPSSLLRTSPSTATQIPSSRSATRLRSASSFSPYHHECSFGWLNTISYPPLPLFDGL